MTYNPQYWQQCREIASYSFGRTMSWHYIFGGQSGRSFQIKMCIVFYPAIPDWGIHLREILTHVPKVTSIRSLCSTVCDQENLEAMQVAIERRIDNSIVIYIHTTEHHRHLQGCDTCIDTKRSHRHILITAKILITYRCQVYCFRILQWYLIETSQWP